MTTELVPETTSASQLVLKVITVEAMHRPVKFFHFHAGIEDYFHLGGQWYKIFLLQPTKRIKSAVSFTL